MTTDLDPGIRAGAPPEAAEPGASPRGLSTGAVLAVALPIILLVVAGTLRFYRLGEPDRIYFDETYYANDANELLSRGVEEDFAVHPPVGKWLLAGGVAAFGFDSFGWRFAAAVAGTAAVGVLYLVGLRLFRRRGIAALAALLLTVEGLAFTMSRIAMLDVFLMLFVTLGFLFLLIDRDRQWEGVSVLAPDDEEPEADRVLPRRPHPWRWLAGVAFGLALATKWSAVLAIAAAGLFVLVSELAWRRRLTGNTWTHPGRIVVSGLGTLVAVPLLVYLLSYTGWFANYANTRAGAEACPNGVCSNVSAVDVAGSWLNEQREIADFHRNLEADHPYRAPAVTWFLMTRPVAYFWEGCDDIENPPEGGCQVAEGNVAEIVGLGNPAIWWPALLAYPVLGWLAVTRRDWRAWAILAFLLLQTVPWHLTPRPVFLFYMTPVTPFVCLALAYVAWRATATRSWRWIPATLAIVAVVTFVFFYPVWVGAEISRPAWDLRMWMSSWV